MTRTRKLTLSVKEFSHLVSESLDIANATPSSQSLVDNTAVFSKTSPKPHPRPSSFQRIFSRPTPGQHEASPEETPEDQVSGTPRKMIAWPFSRSPRKNRPAEDKDNATVRTIPFPCLIVCPLDPGRRSRTPTLCPRTQLRHSLQRQHRALVLYFLPMSGFSKSCRGTRTDRVRIVTCSESQPHPLEWSSVRVPVNRRLARVRSP